MSKPVDKLDFWKERIDTAVKEQYMVYVCNDDLWREIDLNHRKRFAEMKGRVLDAGCGYGRNSVYFDNYVGVDFSPDFIRLAEEKYPDKIFVQADLRALPFADKEFDWAFCVSIKTMIEVNLGEEQWQKMEKELRRVAREVLILEYEDPTESTILR